MMKTNKILGILMAVLMVASAVALVSARPIPNDCISVKVTNHVSESVIVTSYYDNGSVYESHILSGYDGYAPADGWQLHAPKNGYVGVNDVDFLPAQRQSDGAYLKGADVSYVDDDSSPASSGAGKKIGFGYRP
ncbi:MAG: hypothetical protein CfClM3_0512 [Methanobrevibacter sp. CfCl-M3]